MAKVTPHLDAVEGVEKWNVDVTKPDKVLTVSTEEADAAQIEEAVSKAGFKAEKL